MSDEERRIGIVGVNMTNFFNRTLYMYSFGDIQFKKPISLKLVSWTLAWFVIWTIPFLTITGFNLNPIMLIIGCIPPILFGQLSVKPVFAGKTLIDFAKTMFKHASEPRGWTDLKNQNSNGLGNGSFFVESEIWISRRRELQLLADIKENQMSSTRIKK